MQAIQLVEPRHFEPIDVDEPAPPGPDEALVQVHRVGVCGTDVSCYLGKFPLITYPRITGHELGVEVVAVGEGVTNVAPGDTCSVEPYMNCQECFACRRGASNCCANLEVLGVHTDGGLRSRFTLPARKLHPARSLAYEQLALVETLAIGCHANDRGNPQAGEHALIIGAGPIGLATLEFTRLSGAEITVLDMNADRLRFCEEKMGVAHTVQFKGDDSELESLREITGGDLYPVVTDATGNCHSMSAAFQYVAATGKLVYVGITTEEVHFTHMALHKPEITLLASRNALPADFDRIIGLIEEGKIDTGPWITHRTPFAEMIANFDTYTKPESGVIKAIVEL